MDTLLYWITRLQPIVCIDSSQETIIVFGNRCGAEGETTYVGTSTVLGIKSGEILLYGILGRDEESLLVVDTDALPYAKLRLGSQEPAPAEDQAEDRWEPQVGPSQGAPDQQRMENNPGTRRTHGMGMNPALPTDALELTLEAIVATEGLERYQHQNDHWPSSPGQPEQQHTNGNSRIDGSCVRVKPSSRHVSCTDFAQAHVAAAATQNHYIGGVRLTVSEGDCARYYKHDFPESDEESLLSGSFPESEVEYWPDAQQSQLYRGGRTLAAVGNLAGRLSPIARCPPDGLLNLQSEQSETGQFDVAQMMSCFALDNGILPSSKAEAFKAEDIYKYVHGKNLTSEHHIRYYTNLLREKRARQGLPADVDDDEDDQYVYPEEEEDVILKAHLGSNVPRHDPGPDLQPEPSYGYMIEARRTFGLENSAEPTPIADTPMSYMTQFSPTRNRRHYERRAPAILKADPGQVRSQSQFRSVEELASGLKTRDSVFGEIRIAIAEALAGTGRGEDAACYDRVPALSRTRPKETSVSLQDPSRRPKAATRQVPPLRLVPRAAPTDMEMERGAFERSRRAARQFPSARETYSPNPRDTGRDRDRKPPVPTVLVCEGEYA